MPPPPEDSHVELPLDPDAPDARPLHLQPAALARVGLGGCLGTAARIGLEVLLPRPAQLPLPTLVVNLIGAFVLGVLLEHLVRRGPDTGRRQVARLVAGTGFCGALTTYSSLAVEAVQLIGAGRAGTAAAYVGVSLVAGAAAAAGGIAVASVHHHRRLARTLGAAASPAGGVS